MNELLDRVLNTDTLINLAVFVFIGLMVWLYGRDAPTSTANGQKSNERGRDASA